MEKRHAKPSGERGHDGLRAKKTGRSLLLVSMNQSNCDEHPIFVAGIARSRPERLQYAKQNSAQA
jgi:hypothetical protein